MRNPRLAGLLLALAAWPAMAGQLPDAPDHHGQRTRLQRPAAPQLWHRRPPSAQQSRFQLPDRLNLAGHPLKRPLVRGASAECHDLDRMATYRGSALVAYLLDLPDAECTYGLFSAAPAQASVLYSPENLAAVSARFAQEAAAYRADNASLLYLTLYLRAGYYLAHNGVLPEPDADLSVRLRQAIGKLLDDPGLFAANASAYTSAQEIGLLITNMHDEISHLPAVERVFVRYTNSATNPDAATRVRESAVAGGLSGLLNVVYYAHFRADPALGTAPGLMRVLFDFVRANRTALIGTDSAFLLRDAAREGLRFMQYPALKPIAAQEARALLASSSMTGLDNELWLAAAEAVKYYDAEHCADYGTCNLETRLADAVLDKRYPCGNINLRAQGMRPEQFQSACSRMRNEEAAFHQQLATGRRPVADDYNRTLEVVVFSDYDNYSKYAPLIYGIDTNNGGIYLEGDPADRKNQARFIAHEASWLRPVFSVWNLEHEYVHYLDGRFDLYGDFARSTRQATVWWIEGLAEYVSKGNDNPKARATARSGQYTLGQIFANSYDMPDYANRAYDWGYMAVRFMFERHRDNVGTLLDKLRRGDYAGYAEIMRQLGDGYDAEFTAWVGASRARAAHG